MKDAFGHGSNGIGGALKDRRVAQAKTYGSFTDRRAQPISSNGMAAAALMNGLKSTMAPIHDGATGRSDSDNPRQAFQELPANDPRRDMGKPRGDAWSNTPGGDRETSMPYHMAAREASSKK